MNVLIFSHEFPPRLGGVGNMALQFAKFFSNSGCNVTVVTADRKEDYNYPFTVKKVKIIGRLWFLSYYIFFKINGTKKFDYLILNDGAAIYSAAISFPRHSLSRAVAYIHGFEPLIMEKRLAGRVIFFKALFTKTLANCYKIIAVSNYIKEGFFSGNFVNLRSKVQVIHNSIDNDIFFREHTGIYSQFLSDASTVVLLTVARMVQKKGFLTKLRIFEKLLLKNRNYIWAIVGDGPYLDVFKEIVITKGLERKIIFFGARKTEDLRSYYSDASFFWLLSDLDESFGLVYLEAMACGCIPIAWNRCGPREIINHMIDGCLANNEAEVIDFIENGYVEIDYENLSKRVFAIRNGYKKILEGLYEENSLMATPTSPRN
jgi:L-malate glycosyltransferase